MKKIIISVVLIFCCFGTIVACDPKTNTPSTPEDSDSSIKNEITPSINAYNDVKVINNTGVEINELYISPSDNKEWGGNVLNVSSLLSGYEVKITFQGIENTQYWDLMVKDLDGNSITWERIDLFKISEITLNYDSGTGNATATYY